MTPIAGILKNIHETTQFCMKFCASDRQEELAKLQHLELEAKIFKEIADKNRFLLASEATSPLTKQHLVDLLTFSKVFQVVDPKDGPRNILKSETSRLTREYLKLHNPKYNPKIEEEVPFRLNLPAMCSHFIETTYVYCPCCIDLEVTESVIKIAERNMFFMHKTQGFCGFCKTKSHS